MRFSAATVLGFVAAALAQLPTADFDPMSKPDSKTTIAAGSTYDITWQALDKYDGTVNLTLIGGASTADLHDVRNIKAGVQNSLGTYAWTVDSDLGDLATYGIRINWEKNVTIFQWSFNFTITKTSGSGSSSSSSSSSASTTVSAPSSAAVTDAAASNTVSECSSLTKSIVTGYTTAASYPTGGNSSVPSKTASGGFTPTVTPSSVSTAGAAQLASGGIALVGGLLMAVML